MQSDALALVTQPDPPVPASQQGRLVPAKPPHQSVPAIFNNPPPVETDAAPHASTNHNDVEGARASTRGTVANNHIGTRAREAAREPRRVPCGTRWKVGLGKKQSADGLRRLPQQGPLVGPQTINIYLGAHPKASEPDVSYRKSVLADPDTNITHMGAAGTLQGEGQDFSPPSMCANIT